ncbi:MAG: isochorismatase family cysteine hydrolase [Pseudomonadota bacterium]
MLIIDVQNACARKDGADFKHLTPAELEAQEAYYFGQIEDAVVPNIQRLQEAFRAASMEIFYAVIESLTHDGRDRSLDYKISGFHIPKGSWDGQVLDAIAPADDEIVFKKTSSDAFASTNVHYVLGNLGIRQLVMCGLVTDQCVESAVRHACDLGYLVTLVTDACATHSADRQESSLRGIRGYCRQRTTEELLEEVAALQVT